MREWLKGKKTYITIAIGVIAIWLDVYLGIGLSEKCSSVPDNVPCNITVQEAIKLSWAAVGASFMKAGIDRAGS